MSCHFSTVFMKGITTSTYIKWHNYFLKGIEIKKIKVKRTLRVVPRNQNPIPQIINSFLLLESIIFFLFQFSLGINNQHLNNLTNIISNYNWVFIPLLNPDGYVYTWYNKTTRLWRKNRSVTKEQQILWKKTNNELCIGVDINRNFDEAWGG